MTQEPAESDANDELSSAGPFGQPSALDRVEELTWALVDEQINEDEFGLLENLLLSDDEARDVYIDCIQLHTELLAHYAEPAPSAGDSQRPCSPVLSFLNAGLPGMGADSPQPGDSHS
jgi:hypothetical protein